MQLGLDQVLWPKLEIAAHRWNPGIHPRAPETYPEGLHRYIWLGIDQVTCRQPAMVVHRPCRDVVVPWPRYRDAVIPVALGLHCLQTARPHLDCRANTRCVGNSGPAVSSWQLKHCGAPCSCVRLIACHHGSNLKSQKHAG